MSEYVLRSASIEDIPFLVNTIIEAEKGGTDILSYSSVFGITEVEAKKYITQMLEEEIDGCELSVSSFLVAEDNGVVIAALSAWVEGAGGVSSIEIKGNLLGFVLPQESIKNAARVNNLLKQVRIDYVTGSLQKGAGYVIDNYRNKGILGMLTEEIIRRVKINNPEISEVYTQVFGCNIPAIKANERVGFEIVKKVEAENDDVLNYLPSKIKFQLKRNI
ncbi:GNAT family N-acetyltransferase [Carboxylicivirga caseinilyticus]|uniref:GNAT family N-acetyltransferase n=1 Tax=Carboxylicivirga caseinilyticus TaxID=3417572 RepID=UPI003D331BDE|nr:hypothetical protein [Marinilabiliaceae bacterium A049]